MSFPCGSRFIVLSQKTTGMSKIASYPLRCKSWDCPECAKRKSIKYGHRIAAAFKNQQLYFYTFTFYHNNAPIEVWRKAALAWNSLNIAIHKKIGRFPYVKILECHTESNFPHYHILSSALLPAVWLGEQALAAGFGYQIRLQRVSSSGVNGYMRKYLGKSWPRADAIAIRKDLHLRVFTCSRGLPQCPPPLHPWRFERVLYSAEGVFACLSTVIFSMQSKEIFYNLDGLDAPFPSFKYAIVNHPHTNELNWKERFGLC